MRQIELDYEELKQDFIEELGKLGSEGLYQRGILATSEDGHVTARRMRIIADGLNLYFYTDRGSRKCDQILANPNVAIVAGFVPPCAVSPLTPGSVSVTCNSTKFGSSMTSGLPL